MRVWLKQRARKPRDGDDILPPLDHDETARPDPETLADYLDTLDENFLGDPDSSLPEEADLLPDGSFSEDAQDSWVSEESDSEPVDVDLGADETGSSWVEREGEGPVTLDDAWFEEDEEPPEHRDDGGREGPIGEERFFFEDEEEKGESFADDPESQEAEEDVLDTMQRLGIRLPGCAAGELARAGGPGSGLVLEKLFLGPEAHRVAAAAFAGGSPIAAGDGFFILGADGMLHPQVGFEQLIDWSPTSLFAHGDAVFVGTAYGGVVRVDEPGRRFIALNSWYTHGLTDGVERAPDRLSTAFTLHGQVIGDGLRLLGLTGEGQLFVSQDDGASWQSLQIGGRCVMVRPVEGAEDILALVGRSDGRITLQKSNPLGGWSTLRLPGPLMSAARRSPVIAAASGPALLVAVEAPGVVAYSSMNDGRTWNPLEKLTGVTALCFDPEEPRWAASATFDAASGFGTVWVTSDSCRTWQPVLVTQRPVETSALANRVCDLVIDLGRTRRVLVVTTGGIYLVTLARPGVSH